MLITRNLLMKGQYSVIWFANTCLYMDADINMNKDPPNAELLIFWDLSCPASCRIINISIPRTEWSYLIAFLLTRTLNTRTLLDKSKMTRHSMQSLPKSINSTSEPHLNSVMKAWNSLRKLLKTIHNYKYVIYRMKFVRFIFLFQIMKYCVQYCVSWKDITRIWNLWNVLIV